MTILNVNDFNFIMPSVIPAAASVDSDILSTLVSTSISASTSISISTSAPTLRVAEIETASPADLDVVVGDVLHLDDRSMKMDARVIIVHYTTS